MKLQVKDVGEIEIDNPLTGESIKATAREWTIALSDEEITDLIILMLEPAAKLTGVPVTFLMEALLRSGVDNHNNIKRNLPILAAVITEKRRLDGVGVEV